jgi:6-phosphogluconolactonase
MTRTLFHTIFFAACIFCLSVSVSVQAQTSRFYFGTSQSKGIYFADLDAEKGTLSEPKLAIALGKPGFIAFHPGRPFLYATSDGIGDGKNDAVAAMRINPDGTLALIAKQSTGGRGSVHVSVDATGQTLLAANYGSGSVASFRILDDGSLTEARSIHQHVGKGAHRDRQKGPHAHAILPNPENTFAYAPDLGIDKVMIYGLDPAAGTLVEAGSTAVPGKAMGPRHMTWSADGRYAYVLNELDVSLSVFKAGEEPGSLEFIETVSILPNVGDKENMTGAEVCIRPDGRFVYASIRDLAGKDRDVISVITRFEDGFRYLATVFGQVSIPRNFNIDPTGNWMLVGGQKSHDLALFKIDPHTGIPTFSGTKIPFDGGPICIEPMPETLTDSTGSPEDDRVGRR